MIFVCIYIVGVVLMILAVGIADGLGKIPDQVIPWTLLSFIWPLALPTTIMWRLGRAVGQPLAKWIENLS